MSLASSKKGLTTSTVIDVKPHSHSIINVQAAGLRRLSARANKAGLHQPHSGQTYTLGSLAQRALDRLQKLGIVIATGLSEEEFSRIEASLGFTFPPDLRAILKEGLPTGAGFPDWRSAGLKQLRLVLSLPVAAICYEVASGRLWIQQCWGEKPQNTEKAICIARAALLKAPKLVPIYRNCYIPASPNLAGNPVLFLCRKAMFFCALNLGNYFDSFSLDSDFSSKVSMLSHENSRVIWQSFRSEKESIPINLEIEDAFELSMQSYKGECGPLECWAWSSAKGDVETIPRKSLEMINRKIKALRSVDGSLDFSVERWGNASHRRAVYKDGSSHGPVLRKIEFWGQLVKIMENPKGHLPYPKSIAIDAVSHGAFRTKEDLHHPPSLWLERYLDQMAMLMRTAGWNEGDVVDMFGMVSPSLEEPMLHVNPFSVMEGLVLQVNTLSDALRKAGWSVQDVAESFDVDLSFHGPQRRRAVFPDHIAVRVSKLEQSMSGEDP